MSFNRWVYKQNGVYIHNAVLFGYKKKWNSDRCYKMEGHCKLYANWNKPDHKIANIVGSYETYSTVYS